MQSIPYVLILLFFISCKSKESSTSSESATIDLYADTVESGINTVSGAADDASNAPMVSSNQNNFWKNLLINDAYAAACSRSLTNNGGGSCTRSVNCEVGAYVWSGTVQLSFSNGSTCSIGGNGESFTRSVNFTRTGPRGTLQTTSGARTTWDNESVGGGTKITQIGAGDFYVEILGQHNILTRNNGNTVFDVSIETPTPLPMNQLARNGRQISNGTVRIYHNFAEFTAEHTFTNLTYSSGCCYPTGGTLSSTLTGSRTGSGSVEFSSTCGQMSATLNGVTKSFTAANCE